MNKKDPLQYKSKIGLFFLAGDSWWEMGACTATSGRYAGFIEKIEERVKQITLKLSQEYEIITSGIVHTVKDAIKEAKKYNEADVDAIIYCPIIWTNDQPLVAFIQNITKVPLLLWSYDPYGKILDYYRIVDWLVASAPVSVQQSTGILQQFNWSYSSCFGNEDKQETQDTIRAFVKAATTKKSLLNTRIAVIPSPCRLVKGTWFHELELLAKTGVELDYISVKELEASVKAVTENEIKESLTYYKKFPSSEVTDSQLRESIRISLGLVKLVDQYGLSGIALEDFNEELTKVFGYRPHLYHPGLGERFCTVGLEADVLGVLATIIAGRLSGRIGMFSEFFTIEKERNLILMGHPGYGEISFADEKTIEITPDIEIDDMLDRGVWLSYRAKAGFMSFINLSSNKDNIHASLFSGESIAGPRLMEGYSHLLIKPEAKVESIFSGVTKNALFQHWGAALGDIRLSSAELFALLDIEFTSLD